MPVDGVATEREVRGAEADQRIRLPIGIGAVARPGSGFRGGDDLRADGIQFDVGATLEQVDVIRNEQAFEAVLPDVPDVAVGPMKVVGIGEVEPLDGPAEFRARSRSDHKVDMVGHQAIVVDLYVVLLAEGEEPLAVPLPVAVVAEDRGPVVATRQDVVASVIDEQAGRSRHHRNPSKREPVPIFQKRTGTYFLNLRLDEGCLRIDHTVGVFPLETRTDDEMSGRIHFETVSA